MRRIAVGFLGVAAVGAALFSAPLLWSQLPGSSARPMTQRPGPEPEKRGPTGAQLPGGDDLPNGFPGPLFGPPIPPVLEALDANGDGAITPDEISSATTALKTLDKNGDGELTADELMPALPFFPGGPGGPGFGGPGGPMGQQRQLVKEFDADGDGRLNLQERTAARQALGERGGNRGPGGRGFGPPGGFGGRGNRAAAEPGPQVSPAEVETYPAAPLYEPTVLRTLFLEFENEDWEAELADFKGTDVDVPAKVIVDGRIYPNVGVHFRGMSSYMMVPAGSKRSLNLSFDFVDPSQRLYGYKTLNLLNGNGDPSMMSTALYSHIARQYIPAPKSNFVKVVINGESWGVYANVQQFNKEFLAENYESDKGARWKVSGSPMGDGGLRYLGEDIDEYRRRFEIKSKDSDKSWKSLIALCRTLNETPTDQLEEALTPILDIDSLLWFLAMDVTLVNSDGYWTRASDYNIFRDMHGKFHIIPHDMNEAFHGGRGIGPGGPRGPGRRGPGGPGGFGPPDGFEFPGGLPGGALPGGPTGPGQLDSGRGLPSNDVARRRGPDGQGPGRWGPGESGGGPGDPGFPPGDPGFGPGFGPGGPGFGPGGPGFGPGGPGFMEGGVDLDPLIAVDDPRKPLRSKLLAVPSLRAKYLQHVRTLAEISLDWKNLGPVVAQYRLLIEKDVEADTRKLTGLEAFIGATSDSADEGEDNRGLSLRSFVERRCKFLLEYPEITELPR